MICHPWASTYYDQPIYLIELFVSTHYKNMKGDMKCHNWGRLG